MALVLISHDLGVVADMCDRVCVMYAGRIVEEADAAALFARPAHPYAAGLLGALPPLSGPRRRLLAIPGRVPEPWAMPPGCAFAPRCDRRIEDCDAAVPGLHAVTPGHRAACIRAHDACWRWMACPAAYAMRRGWLGRAVAVHAVEAVSLTVAAGRTLGVVGESGCGKSTTGRLALGLEAPDGGTVRFAGAAMPPPHSMPWRRLRARMQLVPQDPLGALDRRLSVARQIAEPLAIHGIGSASDRSDRVATLLEVTWGCARTRRPATRTPCPAGSGSAWCWRARWPRRRTCWCATSRSRRWTSRSRRRS